MYISFNNADKILQISLTLRSDQINYFKGERGDIIAMKNIKINEYNNIKNLNLVRTTIVIINLKYQNKKISKNGITQKEMISTKINLKTVQVKIRKHMTSKNSNQYTIVQ
eukprot:XP_016662111.1 PREDICTED: uncharacterized protein LOC103310175 [Acyrthosiphon pisum]